MGCQWESSCFWDKMALIMNPLASVSTVDALLGSKCLSSGAFRKHSLRLLKADLASMGRMKGLGTDFLVSSVRGQVILL